MLTVRPKQVGNFQSVQQEWDDSNPCPFCGCIYLKSNKKRGSCCKTGEYTLPTSPYPNLHELPQGIFKILSEHLEHMTKWSSFYNKKLSPTITGVNHHLPGQSHGYERLYGPSCVKICGRTYHTLPTTCSPNSGTSISFLIFDAQEIARNCTFNDEISPAILQSLHEELSQFNPYTAQLAQIGSTTREAKSDEEIRELIPHLNSKTSIFEIASIVSDRTNGEFTIHFKKDGQYHRLTGNNPQTESLVYPLFFCFGERGWSPDLKKDVPAVGYLASRILRPELKPAYAYTSDDLEEHIRTGRPVLMRRLSKGGKWLPCNRFTLMSRLKQYYLVEFTSQMVESRLKWISQNQAKFRSNSNAQRNDGDEDEEDNDATQRSTFLSDSFTGSARY